MATIHLMVGFIGFGKSTIAKKLSKELPAVCLSHDDFMVMLYGRDIPEQEFRKKYDIVDTMLWGLASQIIKCGLDVIMDYGFWNKEKRAEAYSKAKKITDNIIFHNVHCDMQIAKQRVLTRTMENNSSLKIDENCFDLLSKQFVPIEDNEKYKIINYDNS